MHNYKVASVKRLPKYLVLSLLPSGDNKLDFLPGQYVTLSFKRSNQWSPARCFSLTSSPLSHELRFAMRPNGRFTSKVSQLEAGTPVHVQGPFGSFTIDPDYDKRIVMLAGGIGITPFLSQLNHASKTGLTNPITLLYACNSAQDIPFYDEIMSLSKTMPNLNVYFLVKEGLDNPSKNIYRKKLNFEVLSSVVKNNFTDYSYFICGPKNFNEGFKKNLKKNSVSHEQLVIESFNQSTSLNWFNLKLSVPSMTYLATGTALLLGFAFFMVVDLTRYIPTVQAKSVSPTTTTNNTSSSSTQQPSNPQSSTSNNSSNLNSTPSNSSSSSNSQPYTPPVSSVS